VVKLEVRLLGGLQPWHLIIGVVVIVVGLAIVSLVVVVIARLASAGKPARGVGRRPGWYPDPRDPSFVRYFDGRQWTPSVHSVDKPPA